jgi:predicted CXXCH cytochrome family protein
LLQRALVLRLNEAHNQKVGSSNLFFLSPPHAIKQFFLFLSQAEGKSHYPLFKNLDKNVLPVYIFLQQARGRKGEKMKRWINSIVVIAFATAAIIGIALAQADKITIDNKYPKKVQTPVILSHKAHVAAIKDCNKCHHTWKKEERKTPQKCAECHKAADTSDKGLKKAFHKLCIDCHKDLEKQGKKAGPTTKCSDCHASKK